MMLPQMPDDNFPGRLFGQYPGTASTSAQYQHHPSMSGMQNYQGDQKYSM
jgi:hypothetical protein